MTGRLTVKQHVQKAAGHELGEVFDAIATAARQIARKIRFAGLSDVIGAAGAVNVQGEQQQKLDVFANEILTQELGKVRSVAAIVSEEDEEPVAFQHEGAKFVVIFDPLDGSSNIDVNVNVGTIVSVQEVAGDLQTALKQPGSKQIAACYVVYGPSIVLVVTTGAGVASFTLDENDEFVRTADGMRMPEQGSYYSANEANASSWPTAYREYIAMLQRGELGGKAYSSRYIGSLVADFHRTLLKGGVFLYPPTAKTPRGKLRLLYEANPLAFIAEQAHGAATNGPQRILELVPEAIHERTALIVGSRREVDALQKAVLAAGDSL